MIRCISNLLDLQKNDVIAIVGSGGKTSLLQRLAMENHHQKTLISTTTKMHLPDYDNHIGENENLQIGRNLFYEKYKDDKISVQDIAKLKALCQQADLSLLECDGARMLPLKGWNHNEPQVPDFTTLTIGVLPLWVLGAPVSDRYIHRLTHFCAITDATLNKPISLSHFHALITHPAGLFGKSIGRKILFFNWKNEQSLTVITDDFLAQLPQDILIISGNAHTDKACLLKERADA